ncbi:hypothetical protein D0856_27610 [Vibrio owensii]|uniref:ankyrin repeat domain-containing protein n=1 Tax=Vibrio owensii TaxID=696485 RepID=UPI000EFC96DF|nr:ankyrin repeat domain-containing protein [Vibrio owensii]AYO23606.1 hypothetical protein D0856_27610 [Vibrio owensii]
MKNRWLGMACALPLLVACDHQNPATNTIESQYKVEFDAKPQKISPDTKKCDWNDQDSEGQTLLHKIYTGTAWTEKSFSEKRTLLLKGFKEGCINPNLQDNMGYTAAHYAIAFMYEVPPYDSKLETLPFIHPIELLDLLVSQPNFNPNIRDYYYRNSPLMLLIGDKHAFKNDTLNKVNYLKRTKEIISTFLKRDDVVFNWQNKKRETISSFIDKTIDSVYISPCNCTVEPHQTLEAIKDIKLQIEKSTNKLLYPYSNDESTGLYIIFEDIGFDSNLYNLSFYNDYLLESLELGADPNFISNDQYTFLNLLSDINGRYYGADVESNNALRTKLAKTLIQHGADVNLTTEGKTPLYFALGSSNTELVKLLLAHSELDLNHQDREGNTAIMKFFKYHDSDTFEEQSQLLFQRRSDINWQQKNYQGNNLHDILHQLVTKYNREEMKIWIEESLRVNTQK